MYTYYIYTLLFVDNLRINIKRRTNCQNTIYEKKEM